MFPVSPLPSVGLPLAPRQQGGGAGGGGCRAPDPRAPRERRRLRGGGPQPRPQPRGRWGCRIICKTCMWICVCTFLYARCRFLEDGPNTAHGLCNYFLCIYNFFLESHSMFPPFFLVCLTLFCHFSARKVAPPICICRVDVIRWFPPFVLADSAAGPPPGSAGFGHHRVLCPSPVQRFRPILRFVVSPTTPQRSKARGLMPCRPSDFPGPSAPTCSGRSSGSGTTPAPASRPSPGASLYQNNEELRSIASTKN